MKVLLGLGGDDESRRALERTVERAAAAGDDLTVAVVDVPRSDRSLDEVESDAREVLAGADVRADVRVLSGDPGSALVELAEVGGYDMLVLGGGRRSPMGKITIGDVAEFVLLNARVSVKLVR